MAASGDSKRALFFSFFLPHTPCVGPAGVVVGATHMRASAHAGFGNNASEKHLCFVVVRSAPPHSQTGPLLLIVKLQLEFSCVFDFPLRSSLSI